MYSAGAAIIAAKIDAWYDALLPEMPAQFSWGSNMSAGTPGSRLRRYASERPQDAGLHQAGNGLEQRRDAGVLRGHHGRTGHVGGKTGMDTTQPRHELKYFIPVAEAPRLRNKLEKVLHRDVHGDAYDAYHIRSLYFDDAMSSASFDKYSGVKDRAKYRIRMYGLNDRALYLERKRKIGDLIAKDGQRITRRLAEQLMTGDPTGLEKLPDPRSMTCSFRCA